MSDPVVSCIVPVFNGERYLSQALDSIFAQSYANLEVIAVNDGSTDASAGILRSYKQQVRCLEQSDKGPAAARNLGANAARGEYLAFLDQDDLWHADKLTRQLARFEARPDVDLCIGYVQMFWIEELQEEAVRLQAQPRTRPQPGYTSGALLVRRNVFEKVGGFDSSLWFGDAMEWFLRAAEHGAVMELLPQVLLYHRMHAANLTRRRRVASADEFLGIVKRSLDQRRQGAAQAAPLRLPGASES